MLEDSIVSFLDKSKADLLIYYARNTESKINETDVEYICNLITLAKDSPTKKLNILLHTLGGQINAAIGLVEYLKDKYPEKINSIVITIAKSSGSFIALSSNECYMHAGSILSDFTLDQTFSSDDYTEAQRKSTQLAFSGVCGRMDASYWIQKFVLNSNPHGEPIPKSELLGMKYVEKLTDFPCRVKSLVHVHNEIIDEFKNNPETMKVYGFNDLLFRSK